jgi:hypothetical protein
MLAIIIWGGEKHIVSVMVVSNKTTQKLLR